MLNVCNHFKMKNCNEFSDFTSVTTLLRINIKKT